MKSCHSIRTGRAGKSGLGRGKKHKTQFLTFFSSRSTDPAIFFSMGGLLRMRVCVSQFRQLPLLPVKSLSVAPSSGKEGNEQFHLFIYLFIFIQFNYFYCGAKKKNRFKHKWYVIMVSNNLYIDTLKVPRHCSILQA